MNTRLRKGEGEMLEEIKDIHFCTKRHEKIIAANAEPVEECIIKL